MIVIISCYLTTLIICFNNPDLINLLPKSLCCYRLDDGLKIVLPLGNMSDGVDGGGGENEVDSHSSLHAETGDSSNHREEETLDPDNEAALNTNYDSSDGAVPVFR